MAKSGTTTELTHTYIKEHPDIRSCLKKDLINYSSLARLIAKDLGIEKKTSKEAILIAARRFQAGMKGELARDQRIRELLSSSEIEVRNKICTIILEKGVAFDRIAQVQQEIKRAGGTFYAIEGSSSYLIITQDLHRKALEGRIGKHLLQAKAGLALIHFKSPPQIEDTVGVMSYLTSLFAEHGVNIIELMSCWRDTILVIEARDVQKALEFLRF